MYPLQVRPLAFEDGFGGRLELNGAEDAVLGKLIAFHITDQNQHELHIALPADLAPVINERVRQSAGRAETLQFDDGFGNKLVINQSVFQIVTRSGDTTSVNLPVGMVPDVLAYMIWILDPRSEPPQFISRIRKAASYSKSDGNVDDILKDLASMTDEEVAKLLMNLACRNRVDLAVKLLHRLGAEGRFNDATDDLGYSDYSWERPPDVTWDDLVKWAGVGPYAQIQVSEAESQEPLDQYQAYDYVACFENAFGESLERIPFDTMDFRAEQAGLRNLAENLERFFSEVTYPAADQNQIIPHIVGRHQWTRGLGGFSYIQFLYTPPIWYQEARKYLLFAHKLSFEDPLPQVIDPIVSNINNRSYQYEDVYVKPALVHASHIEMLRSMLINTQRMSRLIRDGIVIPHQMLNERIPNYSRGEYSSVRFPDETSYFLAESFSQGLGPLISQGYVDSFHLPEYLVKKAKELSYGPGEWEDIDWFSEFFDEISVHDEELAAEDPIRYWPDHLYQIALYKRYFEAHKLGHSLHFLHPQGYQIYSILEAADLLTSLPQSNYQPTLDSVDYANSLRHDAVLVNRLDSALQPKLNVLSDDDLASIRIQEDLFEEWRDTLRGILKTVQINESAIGKSDERFVADAVRESFQKWQDSRAQRLRKTALGNLFDVGQGAVFSIISSMALGSSVSLASLSLGALYGVLKGGRRIFSWRKKEDLVKRHFLSVA